MCTCLCIPLTGAQHQKWSLPSRRKEPTWRRCSTVCWPALPELSTKIAAYIQANYVDGVTREEIARALQVSPRYCLAPLSPGDRDDAVAVSQPLSHCAGTEAAAHDEKHNVNRGGHPTRALTTRPISCASSTARRAAHRSNTVKVQSSAQLYNNWAYFCNNHKSPLCLIAVFRLSEHTSKQINGTNRT